MRTSLLGAQVLRGEQKRARERGRPPHVLPGTRPLAPAPPPPRARSSMTSERLGCSDDSDAVRRAVNGVAAEVGGDDGGGDADEAPSAPHEAARWAGGGEQWRPSEVGRRVGEWLHEARPGVTGVTGMVEGVCVCVCV